jgi:hypothetical protein
MAIAGGMTTRVRKLERTPNEAAARLIAVPANIDQGREFEGENRQAEKAVIAFDHGGAEAAAGGNAERRSGQHDDEDKLHIMQHKARRRESKRLQRRDLLALRRYHAP